MRSENLDIFRYQRFQCTVSDISCGLRFHRDVPGISKRLPILPVSLLYISCVRTCVVGDYRLVYSCYIARLVRTSICRADKRWMTKSRTVDPKSRFSLSTTTRACYTRILERRGACAHIILPCRRTRKPFSVACVRVSTSARIHPRFQGMFQGRCRTSIIPWKHVHVCLSNYSIQNFTNVSW